MDNAPPNIPHNNQSQNHPHPNEVSGDEGNIGLVTDEDTDDSDNEDTYNSDNEDEDNPEPPAKRQRTY